MNRGRLFAVVILSGYLCMSGSAQEKFAHLNKWVGKYPTYDRTTPRQQFFKLAEIERRLQGLLSPNDYRFLTKTCRKEVPIERIDRYLIVRRCHGYACAYGSVVLVISLDDGATHVAIRNETDTEQRWISSNGKYQELPFDVKMAWFVSKKKGA